jgi:hypothetical protein
MCRPVAAHCTSIFFLIDCVSTVSMIGHRCLEKSGIFLTRFMQDTLHGVLNTHPSSRTISSWMGPTLLIRGSGVGAAAPRRKGQRCDARTGAGAAPRRRAQAGAATAPAPEPQGCRCSGRGADTDAGARKAPAPLAPQLSIGVSWIPPCMGRLSWNPPMPHARTDCLAWRSSGDPSMNQYCKKQIHSLTRFT